MTTAGEVFRTEFDKWFRTYEQEAESIFLDPEWKSERRRRARIMAQYDAWLWWCAECEL